MLLTRGLSNARSEAFDTFMSDHRGLTMTLSLNDIPQS